MFIYYMNRNGGTAMTDKIAFLFSNQILNAGLLSWIMAQVIKLIYYYIRNKEIRLERLKGAGGMPSAHTATTCAMAVTALLTCGYQSAEFAIACILTVIVIYDATGVRWEASLHARALNLLVDELDEEAKTNGESGEHRVLRRQLRDQIPELNESLGHRPIEVCFGAALGILLALLLHFFVM